MEHGDNFAVVAMDGFKVESFYLIMCNNPLFVRKSVSVTDGTTIGMLETTCCEDIGTIGNKKKKSRNYVFLDKQPLCFLQLSFSLCAKFMMPMTTHECRGFVSTYSLVRIQRLPFYKP